MTDNKIIYELIDYIVANTTVAHLPKKEGENPTFCLHIGPIGIGEVAEHTIDLINQWSKANDSIPRNI